MTWYSQNVTRLSFLYVHTYLSKDWVGRFGRVVEPIQEGVVVDVDKELRSSRLGSTSVGHTQGSRSVSDTLMVLSNFIGNASVGVALVGLSIGTLKATAGIGTSSTSTWRVGVLCIGTSKLKRQYF